MTATTKKVPTPKVLVFTIEYRCDALEPGDINGIMNKMSEDGTATVVDVRVEEGSI